MATKSRRLTKLTEKMALSKSTQQQRKPRKVVIPIPNNTRSNLNQKDKLNNIIQKVARPIVIQKDNTHNKIPKDTKTLVIVSSKPKNQQSTKTIELKSPKSLKSKSTKSVTKVAPPEIEQVEYYPNKKKRKICNKKIVLKPKHNFKIVAATNKRKLCTPHKEVKSPVRKAYTYYYKPVETSTSLSVQEMVMMIDETSLSDEDFMEILSCPSPVWWEDPPHWTYVEDPICDVTSEEYLQHDLEFEDLEPEHLEVNENFNKITQKPVNKMPNCTFVKKKQKLESILDNIAKKNCKNDSVERLSISTDDSLELIFNEDDLLNPLENIKIPIENDTCNAKNRIPGEMPPLTRKPVSKKPEFTQNSDFDSISDTNIRFISDDDFCSTNSDDSNCIVRGSKDADLNEINNKKVPNKKAINDLSEYITVYKIIPEQSNLENKTRPEVKNKMDDVRGRLNNFYKKCKNNKRLKTSTPASAMNVKNLKLESNSEVKMKNQYNRLNACD